MNTDITKKSCDYNSYKRVRYFHGMLLTERDFQEEQLYLLEKRRLQNRMLHGWGVVCGLGIKPTTPESSKIVITPGMALDCFGNEIVVCADFEIDLKSLPDLCPDSSAAAKTPCPEDTTKDCVYYVGIKYTEAPTDPVPVYVTGGSCEQKTCEYSRIREGFCIKLFKSPPCHAVLPKDSLFNDIVDCTKTNASREDKLKCVKKTLDDFITSFCETPYPCPTCCCNGEPYVILGSIDFSSTQCMVKTISQSMIDINNGRRYVRTPMFWDYIIGSFFPQITQFLDNPFASICSQLGRLDDALSRFVSTSETPGRFDALSKMVAVNKMSIDQATAEIKSENLTLNKTVVLSATSAPSLAARAVSIDSITAGTPVDLVTDDSGKAIFYVPATVAQASDVSGLKNEFDAKLSEVQQKNADDLKKIDAAYQKQIKSLNDAIKELKTKIK
ncbi:MAG TPA: hypothetical protein VK448_07135 [Dissulfurispiraceae bacterium]|nr:hypothetical protein [Dissulfurispiraceae bacterium]